MEEQSKQSELENTRPPLFQKTITLGNLIQAGVILVALILAYARLQSNDELLRLEYESQKIVTEELKSQLSQSYVRADVHAEQIKQINSKLQDIQDDIKDIKRSLKR